MTRIPWWRTTQKKPQIRAKQAISENPYAFSSELKALSYLTKAGCASTPSLLSHKETKQSDEEWVPGGYKLYILMEKLPGCAPEPSFFSGQMPLFERDMLRSAFKTSWLETVRCGVVHGDQGIRNLIWDKDSNKWWVPSWCSHYQRNFFDMKDF